MSDVNRRVQAKLGRNGIKPYAVLPNVLNETANFGKNTKSASRSSERCETEYVEKKEQPLLCLIWDQDLDVLHLSATQAQGESNYCL